VFYIMLRQALLALGILTRPLTRSGP